MLQRKAVFPSGCAVGFSPLGACKSVTAWGHGNVLSGTVAWILGNQI